MTHEEALKAVEGEADEKLIHYITQKDIEFIIAAYLEARGAVLCEKEVVATQYQYFNHRYERWGDWQNYSPTLSSYEGFSERTRPLHAALSDNPKGDAQ